MFVHLRVAQQHLGEGVHRQAFHQAGAAHLDGAHRNAEILRYLLVLVAPGDELQQLAFARGEALKDGQLGEAGGRRLRRLIGPLDGGEQAVSSFLQTNPMSV